MMTNLMAQDTYDKNQTKHSPDHVVLQQAVTRQLKNADKQKANHNQEVNEGDIITPCYVRGYN